VYVLLFRQRSAGVYSGLDFEAEISNPDDPPAEWRGGFFDFQRTVFNGVPCCSLPIVL
jgi:hypothetical protein